ncbi:MAG: tetraacyldisaccharide 4'-kinase [Bacteroidota bacterium]
MRPHPMLFPFAAIYGLLVWMRNVFFDVGILKTTDVGVPVISIGNITAGGTGKTPIVIETAKVLLNAGKKVAVVSRGYGRKTTGTIVVSDGSRILADAESGGDEPMQIASHVKDAIVIADENRVRGAKKAVNDFGAEVIVLDDGFQHRYIKRSKDIVLVNSRQLPSETMLIPAGYRREPLHSLKRANAVVVTKSVDKKGAESILDVLRIDTQQSAFSCSYQPAGMRHLFGGIAQSTEILKGHIAVAFSGIAAPDAFRQSLESCGVTIKQFFIFDDHHQYSKADLDTIVLAFERSKADFILTTEKDAVRLARFKDTLQSLPVSALIMNVTMHQDEAWRTYLLKGLSV